MHEPFQPFCDGQPAATVAAPEGDRDSLGRFRPGWRGGPGCRPHAVQRARQLLAEAITERDLVDSVSVVRGILLDEQQRPVDRILAANWLATRAAGRPMTSMEIQNLPTLEIDSRETTRAAVDAMSPEKMSPEDYANLAAIINRQSVKLLAADAANGQNQLPEPGDSAGEE